ncbi:MAG: hypothetical protein ACRC5A_06270, partial [Enterobacteriaceae bacterium]
QSLMDRKELFFDDNAENRGDFSENRSVIVLSDKIAKSLLDRFINLAGSQENKADFLTRSDYFAKSSAGISPSGKQQWLQNSSAKLIEITPPNPGRQINYYTVSVKIGSAEQANQLLTQYLEWTNKQVEQQLSSMIRESDKDKVRQLQQKLNDIKLEAESCQQADLSGLRQALALAKKLGIKENISPLNSASGSYAPVRLYMLGERFLTAEIEQRQNTPLILPPEYTIIEKVLQQTRESLTQKISFNSYSYEMAPDLPGSPAQPKRNIIIALGLMLGILSGIGIALIMHTVSRYRQPKRDITDHSASVA